MDGENLKYQIGANIAAYRKRSRLTQAGLAEKLNYSDKAVSKWETGKGFPDVTAEDMAQVGIRHGLSDLSQFTVENCIRNCSSYGGTGTEDVQRQIAAGWELLKSIKEEQADRRR